MKLKDLICFLCIFSYFSFAQEEYNLSGYIIDSETGETLIGANIYITSSKQGVSSNSYGYFSINIKPQKDTIICSYIGYETDSLKINPTSNLNHDFKEK